MELTAVKLTATYIFEGHDDGLGDYRIQAAISSDQAEIQYWELPDDGSEAKSEYTRYSLKVLRITPAQTFADDMWDRMAMSEHIALELYRRLQGLIA